MSETEMPKFQPQPRPEANTNPHHQDGPMNKVNEALAHQPAEPKLGGNLLEILKTVLNPLTGSRENIKPTRRIETFDLTHKRIIKK